MNDKNDKKNYLLPASVVISAIIISASWIYKTNTACGRNQAQVQFSEKNKLHAEQTKEIVSVSEETILPVRWGDLGMRMASSGVIDVTKLETLYQNREGKKTLQNMLFRNDARNMVVNSENSGVLLNLFWALGLGNKNVILETGEMANPIYGGAGNFASTGGWTLAKGGAMEHYSRHPFIVLTPEQQQLVERVSKNIYRPCCNNSTDFPDCNHGMAMLGFLELMASQGVSENEMYKAALQLNSFWFPDAYEAITHYLKSKDIDWSMVDPKEILGADFSSGSGYQKILSQIVAPVQKNNGGCGA